MKKIILLLACLIQGCENQSYLSKDEKTQELTTTLLEIRSGVAYLPKSTELFTGKFVYFCPEENDISINLLGESLWLSNQEENEGEKGNNKIFKSKSVCIEENYLHGKRNGLATAMTSMTSEFKHTYTYKDGVLHGLEQLFCIKDGREEECGATNYKNGIPSGIHKSYMTDKGLYFVSINLGNTQKSDIETATKNLVKDEDKIENHTWYMDSGYLYQKGTGIWAYMGRSKDSSIKLRYKFNYEAKDWLFVKSIIIAADNERFEKKDVTFKRDSSYSGINEWYDVIVLDEDLKIIKVIINSKETTIRFEGDTSYDDYVVTDKEKKSLKNIVDAYEALLLLSS